MFHFFLFDSVIHTSPNVKRDTIFEKFGQDN